MRPEQVLFAQADLVARGHDEKFFQYLSTCFAQGWHQVPTSISAGLAGALINHVTKADAYRVTPDMCDLVQYAAAGLDESDRFDRTLAPTPWGLVHFERGLKLKDVRGRTLLVHWATWGPGQRVVRDVFTGQEKQVAATLTSFWNDMFIEPDAASIRAQRAKGLLTHSSEHVAKNVLEFADKMCGRWGWIGSTFIRDGSPLGPPEQSVSDEQVEVIRKADDAVTEETGRRPYQPLVFQASTNTDRLVHALWLLLNQTITSVTEERLPRSSASRIGRMPIPGKVSVITLRRSSGAGRMPGETHVEWQHRWLVRGHWRNQPCGTNRLETRRIWISGYVKGPDGLPFVSTKKLYNLSR